MTHAQLVLCRAKDDPRPLEPSRPANRLIVRSEARDSRGSKAVGRDQVIPLESHAADTFDIQAGLEGDDIAATRVSVLSGTK